MKESTLRSSIAIFLVVSQFAAIIVTVTIHVLGGMKFEEMTTSLALLVPLFAVHSTTVIKYFVAHRIAETNGSPNVTGVFVFLSFLTAVVFVVFVLGLIIIRALGLGFASFDQFKTALGLAQTCFGVYLALFISSLFGEDSKKRNRGTTGPRTATRSATL